MRAAVLLTSLFLAASARASPPPALTEAEVRSFIEEIDATARARDVQALGRHLSADCIVTLQSSIGGEERTTRLTRVEYLDLLERGFAAIRDLERYEYQSTILTVALNADGRHAIVTSEVNETAVMDGRETKTESVEADTVEKSETGLAVTGVLSRTRARL